MYAIVEIAGQQFKVQKEQEIFVHRLQEEAGSAVEFDHVLLLDNEGKISIGMPNVEGALIKAKIVEHMKADKVTVFHKKRRKGYQKENGHRQYMSKILIEDILTNAKKSEKKAEEKKAVVKKELVKDEAKPVQAKEETPKTEVKKTAKKPVAKKEQAAKKEAAPKTAKKAAPEEVKKPKETKETTDTKEKETEE